MMRKSIAMIISDHMGNAWANSSCPSALRLATVTPRPKMIQPHVRRSLKTNTAFVVNPEFFGNTMVVNGKTWPYLEVEQGRYRFRLLNGSQARFLILKMDNG